MFLDLKSKSQRALITDVAVCGVLVFVATTVWSMNGGEGFPFWAGQSDPLLEGPDSGEWAANAVAFSNGQYDDLDPHRMPTFVILTGLFSKITPSIAYAGHLVNHLVHTLLPIVLYGIGRLSGSRSAGIGAGVMVAVSPLLVAASWRFGVDPTIAFMVPLTLLFGMMAGRWWKMAPIAGVVGAFGASSHFTTLFHPLVGLLAVVLISKGWRNRSLAVAGYVAGVAAGLLVIFRIFPFAGISGLESALFEGIVAGSQSISGTATVASEPAIAALKSGLPDSVSGAVSNSLEQLFSSAVPWGLMVFSLWFGILGIGLKRAPDGKGIARLLGMCDWRGGILLVACLAPLPLLYASGAELRYSYNLLPIVCLVYMRGLVSMAVCFELLIRWGTFRYLPKGWSSRLVGVSGLVIAIFVARSYWANSINSNVQLPPAMSATAGWAIGNRVGELFPEDGGAVSPLREALIYADKSYCPHTVCPATGTTSAFWDCLSIAKRECDGEGDIPWVVVWRSRFDERSEARKMMDEWVVEQFGILDTVEVPFGRPEFKATIVSIPREAITDRSRRP